MLPPPALPEATSPTSWSTPSIRLPSPGGQGQAGLQPREEQVSDRLASPAGGQAAWRWGCRKPAHLPVPRSPRSPAGAQPQLGPPSINLETSSPLLLRLCLTALAPGAALSPVLCLRFSGAGVVATLRAGPARDGDVCAASRWRNQVACLARCHSCQGREQPPGRMLHQLWEDSVNVKHSPACQTSLPLGTCDPLAPAVTWGHQAVLLPGVTGKRYRRPWHGCCRCGIWRQAGWGWARSGK